MKKTVILGNIITVDEKRPFAKAALVKDGLFAYIGENFIYPCFLESHCHGCLAGDRAI